MAVVFNKSDFAMLVFFGTLCIRPATKSKISARASTLYLENLKEDSHPERTK